MKIKILKNTVLLFLLCILYTNGYAQNINVQSDSNTAKTALNFEIVFGVYFDDSYNHKFDAKERKWKLNNGILIYEINDNSVAYADTLTLKETDIKTISNFVKENNLFISINKDLTKDYLNKYGYSESITGQLNYHKQKADFKIKTNSSSSFDEDNDAKQLKKIRKFTLSDCRNI